MHNPESAGEMGFTLFDFEDTEGNLNILSPETGV